ncbi:hypothetical protein TRV_01813 [Trichophyton verrucosum HKI 0517]|uniref:Uncharacterized protein n=1 Tax=Trichophyton verrucosum (strain HKI 0517) TaxID=663202 RepID=D4D400_TRIVH|nr:uncharacterized protein TRV_01813 [Trichophyton verrucosum HKI 0517]EFE43428.1 hypothetical protein TRV_01813 [Trichophyton verrucosum HKI 0517]
MINLVHARQLLAATHNGVTSYRNIGILGWDRVVQSLEEIYGQEKEKRHQEILSSRLNAQYDVTQQHSLKIWRQKKKKEGKKALVPCGDATHRLAFTSGEDFGSRMNPTYSICPFHQTIKAGLLRL